MAESLARASRRGEALASIRKGRALAEPPALAPGASFRDRGALLLCRSREARARIVLGQKADADKILEEVIAGLRQLRAAQPEPITPYIGLVEALQLRARIHPDQRCALLHQALAVWRSWPEAETAYTHRRRAELEGALARCR